MDTPTRHPGGRPAGIWRTAAGRRLIEMVHGRTNPDDAEALWFSAVAIAVAGTPVDADAARLYRVSRRTWARWKRRAAGQKVTP